VAFRDKLKKLTSSVADQDTEKLRDFCTAYPGATPIGEAEARAPLTVVGEISGLRIVPKPDGSPWLEATVTDGTGSIGVLWTGRKRIAGVRAGQRIRIEGRGTKSHSSARLVIYNPIYELLG
jgi:hypothetical protein